jgi:excisionase family DNA binding protein
MDELQVSHEIRRQARRGVVRADRAEGIGLMPMLLTVDDAADLLRTSRRAVYAMVERKQLPGIIRIRRRVLFRRTIC